MSINFQNIALSKREISLLKDVRDGIGTYADKGIDRLIQLNLVYPSWSVQTVSSEPGSCNSDIALTEDGISYLIYLDNLDRAQRSNRSHDWRIAIFSAFAGALLSKPLWAIIDNVMKWVSNQP